VGDIKRSAKGMVEMVMGDLTIMMGMRHGARMAPSHQEQNGNGYHDVGVKLLGIVKGYKRNKE
jgi:hypothetical protein